MADPRHPARARAARAVAMPAVLALTPAAWLAAGLAIAAAALAAGAARGQEAEPAAETGAADGMGDGATITSHGYSFFGDLKYPADFARLDYVNPDVPQGGEISEWAEGTFDSFNRYTLLGNAAALANIGQESLMTGTADDPTALYCLICDTIEYPESLEWVIFTLRPEAAFADGTPLTAGDVKFSHDLFMEEGLESYRAAFGSMIAEVEVLDDARVRFVFAPDSPVRDRIPLAGSSTVLSEAYFERTGARLDETTDEPFLGSGPYVLDSFDIGRRLVFRRDSDYWGNDLPINIGRFNFETIRVEYFSDSVAAFEAFKAGEYTFRNENSSLVWATGYDFPALDEGWVVRAELPNGNLPSAQSFALNLRRETFQDPRVREALGLMFNFEWSNATLFYGLYTRTIGFWNQSDLMAEGVPSDAEAAILRPLVDEGLLDASILTAEAVVPPTSDPERQTDRANLRLASDLLDAAGWIVGDDGLRRKDGRTLEISILESSPAFDRIINPYVENLQRLGIDARLDRVDPAQATQRRDDSDFDMTNWSYALSLEPSTELEQWFGSESADESNRNLQGLQSPAVDRLIDVVVAAGTREEMVTAVNALDRVLRAERFWVPQWYKDVYTVAYYDMYGRPDPLPPYALGETDFWWFDADKAAALEAAGAFD